MYKRQAGKRARAEAASSPRARLKKQKRCRGTPERTARRARRNRRAAGRARGSEPLEARSWALGRHVWRVRAALGRSRRSRARPRAFLDALARDSSGKLSAKHAPAFCRVIQPARSFAADARAAAGATARMATVAIPSFFGKRDDSAGNDGGRSRRCLCRARRRVAPSRPMRTRCSRLVHRVRF